MEQGGSEAIDELLRQAGLVGRPFVDDTPLSSPPLRALSLAIAQKCNLGCTYCYAQQGEFGGAAKNMELADALRAVDLLVATAEPGARLNLAFLGGEPLVNRKVLRAATQRAVELAEAPRREDHFLDHHQRHAADARTTAASSRSMASPSPSASTVRRQVHDALRPFKGGARQL